MYSNKCKGMNSNLPKVIPTELWNLQQNLANQTAATPDVIPAYSMYTKNSSKNTMP